MEKNKSIEEIKKGLDKLSEDDLIHVLEYGARKLKSIILRFGDDKWKMVVKTNEKTSDLSLFAEDELVFQGRYGELVEKLTAMSHEN